jgi:hypothetical protein
MARYRSNPVGFARYMLSPEIGDIARNGAEELAEHMRATAPRGRTGVYASNFRVKDGVDVMRHDRRAAFVLNDSDYATALEVGSWTIRNPPMPMTRALDRFLGG